jgi:cytochrome c
MSRLARASILAAFSLPLLQTHALAAGDAKRGAQVFRVCAACHSVNPDVQLTGPSLAGLWNRKAGTLAGFSRYSDALKGSGVVWAEASLDKWLANPDKTIPGTSMTFPGLQKAADRQDVIAYLKAVSENQAPRAEPSGGGMMMMGRGRVDLKQAPREGQVISIGHCGDTYTVATADGKAQKVWEFNLRFKTDSSQDGPRPGKPVIVGAGMQGDRASVVFADPREISAFIRQACK